MGRDVYVLAARLVGEIHDGDPVAAYRMWDAWSDDVRYAIVVLLACQTDPGDVSVVDWKRRVDRVAGIVR